MKLPIHTAVITHDEGVTQFVAVEHGDLIARIGDWCREHWSSVSSEPHPADVRDLIDAYFYDNTEDSLEVSEDSIDLPEPYASAPKLLDQLGCLLAALTAYKPGDSEACAVLCREVIDTRAVIAKASVQSNTPEPLKVGDRVRIVPEWQDPGDDRYDRIVIKAPADSTRVCIQTFIPGLLIQPVEWIESNKLILLPSATSDPHNRTIT